MKIVISSGHGKYVRGASGIIDEVDEARRVVDTLATLLKDRGVGVVTFHDNTSHSQNENLNTIVNFHNKQTRDLDISVHFNAFEQRTQPVGTEVWYYSQKELAKKLSKAIASVGFIDRGAKQSGSLFFLNSTNEPAVLLEICFVDSVADCDIYKENFEDICIALANCAGAPIDVEEVPPPAADCVTGKCSYFGGPNDTGVSASEGLAFISSIGQAPHLFLPSQPPGTTGLARRLNPYTHYLAMRWDYSEHSKKDLLQLKALVRNPRTGFALTAFPSDWGPNENTGRIVDLSPSLMEDLGLVTDDEVEIVFPYDAA